MVRRANEDKVQAIRALARLARMLERSSGDLNLAHYRVLAAIDEGDEWASRVADRLALGKPTISAAVESLTKRGLLSRTDAVGDRRAATLTLTPAGEAALAEVERGMLERIEDLAGRIPDGEGAIKSLGELGKALDEVIDERAARRAVERGRKKSP